MNETSNIQSESNLSKNQLIKEHGYMTRQKRKTQSCKTYVLKVNWKKCSNAQKEALKMYFVEAKRVWNYLLNQEDPLHYDYKKLKEITYLDKDRKEVPYTIKYLGSSVLQDQIRRMGEACKGLKALKETGRVVGALKYKSEVRSIRFLQYGMTHRIYKGRRFKLQGIKPLPVRGLDQILSQPEIDLTTAHLVYDGCDYYIRLTCFVPKKEHASYKEPVGIDMGLKDNIVLSDGTKYNVLVEESDRLRKLQKVLSKKTKGSNSYYKVLRKARKEYIKGTNQRNDYANKIVHSLLEYSRIVIQDEAITQWKIQNGDIIQHSVLGRVKSRLLRSDKVFVLDKWWPSTQWCPCCHQLTPHDPSRRSYKCSHCSYSDPDRDIHAANNMLRFFNEIQSVAGTAVPKPGKKIKMKPFREDFIISSKTGSPRGF